MYVCSDCGAVFDEPQSWVEPHGEKMSGCPLCAGNYVEAQRCELCDSEYDPDTAEHGRLCCDNCAEDLTERFKEVIHEHFTDYELSIINEIYDGRNIE